MLALGMIEVYGRIGAIEGLDSALKSANVSLVNMVRVGGGLTSVFVEGDVGAVKAAIDSASAAASAVGKLCSSHVIPRPDKTVRAMLDMNVSDKGKPVVPESGKEFKEREFEKEPVKLEDKSLEKGDEHARDESPDSMTVGQLRALARGTEGFPMSKKEIKFAKKTELVKALNEFKADGNDDGGKRND